MAVKGEVGTVTTLKSRRVEEKIERSLRKISVQTQIKCFSCVLLKECPTWLLYVTV